MGEGSETEFAVPYESLTKARPAESNGAVEILCGTKDDETANEYTLIARKIQKMVTAEEKVWLPDENGNEVPQNIQYGDIAILIRSRRHLPDIENALHEADIPYLTTGGIGFYQRQEIYDIMNYLTFLDAQTKHKDRLVQIRKDTSDDISDTAQEISHGVETTPHVSLIGILRGPAFGISDDELYEISQEKGANNFWDKAQNYHPRSTHLQNAIDTLERHMQVAQHIPINQLILTVVNETGMIATLKTGKKGQQRWANYQKLLDIARNFDRDENTRTLSDFIKFLDILITDELRESEAPVDADRGTVQIMTIHAAKGKQFPIVVLPCLDRGSRNTQPPFIDETFGIGFSTHKPAENYDKNEPYVVAEMKNRQSAKEEAETKRLFYVGATRARDRLILSGALSHSGKPQNLFEWLHTHLGIDETDQTRNFDVELEVFHNNQTSSHRFELPIPVHRALQDIDSEESLSPEVEFPAAPKDVLQPTVIGTSLSVDELASYVQCSLRYYLEHVLRLPPHVPADEEITAETEGTDTQPFANDQLPYQIDMDFVVRRVLREIKTPAAIRNLDAVIRKVSQEYQLPNGTVLRTHADNFLISELGKTALAAAETYTERTVHVQIGEHILTGNLPRLFKDAAGHWQIINYKTEHRVEEGNADRPLMELYGILLHKLYPKQKTVTVHLFFTSTKTCFTTSFHLQEMAELAQRWQKRIADLQQQQLEKNLQHCPFCPYADETQNCLIHSNGIIC